MAAAPNKPLLLLAVIELIEQGQIPENRIVLSPDLAEAFLKYWTKVTERKPNIAMPFFPLKKARDSGTFIQILDMKQHWRVASQLKTASRVREVIAYVSLDDELFILLTDSHNREVIRQNTYSRPPSRFQARN